MAWPTIDRNPSPVAPDAPPLLTEPLRSKIGTFLERYETKRAALLPALHVVQETYGFVSWQAMEELAVFLEIPPSDVFDVVTFYTHYWTHPRGKKTIVVCRSISCEVMGSAALLDAFKRHLGVDEHETTPDGAYSLVTEECLALCDHAPCVLINEKKHSRVRPQDVPALLADPNNDKLDRPRSTLYDGVDTGDEATEGRSDVGVGTVPARRDEGAESATEKPQH